MQKENRHILSVLVENSAGVLSQVSRDVLPQGL